MKRHPWFEPLSRRVITTLVCVGWLIFELVIQSEQGIWLWLAVFASVYAIWSFFLSGQYRGEPPADET